MGPATHYYDLPAPLSLRRGGTLSGVRMAYESWGERSANDNNTILILTGLSPGAHAASSAADPEAGWWEEMIGPGKAIDTDRWHVLCVNSLGSCKGSTGPASIDPASGQPWRLNFPELTLEDVASAAAAVLDGLGISHPQAIIGPSMGGMSTLAFASLQPGRCKHLALISTAAQATPFAIAVRSLQRELVRSDRGWEHGNYADGAQVRTGMRLARKLGMSTYRSPQEWQARFGRARQPEAPAEPFGPEFAIESYLEVHAERFIGAFDPNCYLYLSRAMDWFDLADHADGDNQAALQRLQLDSALVIGVATDCLFPLWQQEALARGLTEAGTQVDWHPLPSPMGHDSFLVDIERFGPPLAQWLATLETNRAKR
ncbi:MAG: homoserine O-acetyltransferase [Xanthomonadales bacterium]|nr:homoserine O-acetyltransferase [Xanthomonadales bacterium]